MIYHTRIFTVVACVLSVLVQPITCANGNELYRDAMEIIHKLPLQYNLREPVYNHNNIDNNLFIPQYRHDIDDFETTSPRSKTTEEREFEKAVLLLEQAAAKDDPDALVTAADVYMFGNYSTTANYSKALEYYHRVVSINANGHAYFMLGFLYSTGAFGELTIDQAKANLYYEFGMANGDTSSILALAYRNLVGNGMPINCDLALYYYSRVAHIGIDLLKDHNEENEEDDLFYNIRLPDFNGGIYGDKVSESTSSIYSTSKSYISSKNTLNEFMDIDHESVDYYYDALEQYDGDYFISKNHSKAFEILNECVDYGESVYGAKNYRNANEINIVFLSRCQGLLGHMYLKGHGTERDYEKAFHWLNISTSLRNTSEALNDIGSIYEKGLVNGKQNTLTAIKYYKDSISLGSHEARLNLAKLLINESGNEQVHLSPYRDQIYENVQKAVYKGNTEALYYLGEFLQSGVATAVHKDIKITCENTVMYYKIFAERLERYFMPHLKYAFDELRFGNFKNALIGYLLAAEQGLENAQVSSSYLLCQLQPLVLNYKRKTFSNERVKSSIKYLERASLQNNVDATVLLGDIYLNGIEGSNFSTDYSKAFMYFNKASHQHSSHGSYNLAYMYEYGLGPDNAVDYFMAKRYYDLSLKYRDMTEKNSNKIPINLALLRLRLKFLFNKKKFNTNNSGETTGWLSAFKKIRHNNKQETSDSLERANARAKAHHEGGSYYDDEEYDIGDYLVIFITVIFFMIFFIQNIYRQLRRMRNANQGEQQNDNQQGQGQNREEQQQNGWVGNQFRFRRGNFEFHFFAL